MCANLFPWSGRILRICSLLKKDREPNLRVRLPYTGRHGKDTTVSGAQRILQIESSTLYRLRDTKNVPQEFQTCRNSRCEQHTTGRLQTATSASFRRWCLQMWTDVICVSSRCALERESTFIGRPAWLKERLTLEDTHTHTSIYTYNTIYDIHIHSYRI
jgi:hypothetical protein